MSDWCIIVGACCGWTDSDCGEDVRFPGNLRHLFWHGGPRGLPCSGFDGPPPAGELATSGERWRLFDPTRWILDHPNQWNIVLGFGFWCGPVFNINETAYCESFGFLVLVPLRNTFWYFNHFDEETTIWIAKYFVADIPSATYRKLINSLIEICRRVNYLISILFSFKLF